MEAQTQAQAQAACTATLYICVCVSVDLLPQCMVMFGRESAVEWMDGWLPSLRMAAVRRPIPHAHAHVLFCLCTGVDRSMNWRVGKKQQCPIVIWQRKKKKERGAENNTNT